MKEREVLLEFDAIKAALKLHGFRVGKRYEYWKWKVTTLGWKYTLSCDATGWSLTPKNTSLSYQTITEIIRVTLEGVNRG